MRKDSLAKIVEKTDRLKERLEETRADRIERGLPADTPKPFVSQAMGLAIYQRAQPLIRFGANYADLCNQSDEVLPLATGQIEWAQMYEMDVILLRNVDGDMETMRFALNGVYSTLSKSMRYDSASELVRDMALFVKASKPEYGDFNISHLVNDHNASKAENDRASREGIAEVERLQDDEIFKEEYDKLVEHYRTIEHLY